MKAHRSETNPQLDRSFDAAVVGAMLLLLGLSLVQLIRGRLEGGAFTTDESIALVGALFALAALRSEAREWYERLRERWSRRR